MQEIMIAIVLGIAVGCSDLLNYNVEKMAQPVFYSQSVYHAVVSGC